MKGDVGMKRRESRRYLHQDRKLFITPSLHLGVFSKSCLALSCLALKEHEIVKLRMSRLEAGTVGLELCKASYPECE